MGVLLLKEEVGVSSFCLFSSPGWSHLLSSDGSKDFPQSHCFIEERCTKDDTLDVGVVDALVGVEVEQTM